MLKRTRAPSEYRRGSGKRSLSLFSLPLIDASAHSGDRQRTCAFTTESCQILNELRKKNLLCDAQLSTKTDSREGHRLFPVHRFILAGRQRTEMLGSRIATDLFVIASSPYFRMAFTNIQHNEHSSLQLDIAPDALESLLDYAYTRECRLTVESAAQIIEAAQLCQMTSLFHFCCDYLMTHLNHENIFLLYKLAETQSHTPLAHVTHDYLM